MYWFSSVNVWLRCDTDSENGWTWLTNAYSNLTLSLWPLAFLKLSGHRAHKQLFKGRRCGSYGKFLKSYYFIIISINWIEKCKCNNIYRQLNLKWCLGKKLHSSTTCTSCNCYRYSSGFDILAGPPLEVIKITEEKVLPLSLHLKMVRLSFFLKVFMVFKDYKPEVPSHNSFEFQLCEMLKNPHTIRKK